MPSIGTQTGPQLPDAVAVEVTSRQTLEPDMQAHLEEELRSLPDASLIKGALRPCGKSRRRVLYTVKVFGAYRPAAALHDVEAIIKRFLKQISRPLRQMRREMRKAETRLRRQEAKQIKLGMHPSDLEHQTKRTNRTSLQRSYRARFGSRVPVHT